jgi:erythromycin esterase-like protein
MEDKAISGTTEWTRHEFTIDVPDDTSNINFGFILNGDGAAWFDDVEIELDGVRYEDPARYSFDFENDAVKFLSGGSGQYKIGRVETSPRSGKKCLEMRRRPKSEVPDADPIAIRARADGVLHLLEEKRDALAAKAGAKETDWAIQNMRVVAQCADMYSSQQSFEARDEAMAANVGWILDQNPGQKIVLWAHNGHVSRSPFFGMRTMGSFLDKAHGKEMVVVGFATGEGTYTAIAQGGGGLKRDLLLEPPPVGSVEEIFTRSGLERAIVDIRSASATNPGTHWAATERLMRGVGAMEAAQQHFPTTPANAFDILVWQARTTASKAIE